jgi:hypothetical protein
MEQMMKVHYIGPKPEKRDNVNPTPSARGRIWRGFGDALPVPTTEALALLNYPDVWCSEAAFSAHQERAGELQARAEQEAARVKAREDAIAEEQRKAAIAAHEAELRGKTDAQDDGSDEIDRDTLLRATIMGMNPESEADYTKTKPRKPRVDRITEIAGTAFSADEITRAFQELIAAGSIKVPA